MRTQVIRKTVACGLIRAALPAPMLAAALLSAVVVSAQETTMQVPQGSPVFPTIGQVDCLEEASSGRLCAASFECVDGSAGELWSDMGNPDGRRTTSADHDVAIKRGCVVTVDGRAAVRWFSGFRPAGRTGDLLGVTTMAAAKRPVVRTTASGASDGLLLDWLVAEHDYDVQALLDRECGHIRDEATDRRTECEYPFRQLIGSVLGIASTPFTRCVAEESIQVTDRLLDVLLGHLSRRLHTAHETFGHGCDEACCGLYTAEAARF